LRLESILFCSESFDWNEAAAAGAAAAAVGGKK